MIKKFQLNDVITEKSQNEIQDSFSLATGFGVIFTDAQGNHIGSKNNFCKFCTKINETKKGAFYCSCTNKNAITIALKTKKPCIYICHAGLVNIEIPLIYENECIGAITAGNVLCSEDNLYPREPAIQKIRFGSRIDYILHCAEELENMFIPFFSIQPLVENAIEHGILGMPCGGKLILQCISLEDHIQIQIKDNGVGIPKGQLEKLRVSMKSSEPPDEQHVGLFNCYHRFHLTFKKRVSFDIQSHIGKGTTIIIKILKN